MQVGPILANANKNQTNKYNIYQGKMPQEY